MVIVFLLFLCIRLGHFRVITTSNLIYNCSFLNNIYLSNGAVSDQYQFQNSTSIELTAHYAFISSTLLLSTFKLGLIYRFSKTNYLVPFPVIFNCASIVDSCQLKTMTNTRLTSHNSESIHVQLTSFNYSTRISSVKFNQMGLYLKEGRYQLSNCSLNYGQQMTDPKTIFYIQIQYEKSAGSSCDPINNLCGSPSLTTCSSSKCICRSSANSLISYSGLFYCADMMNISNCNLFPSRCITWCNQTTNYLCICPMNTLKIQRNNLFICELPVNSKNCSMNSNAIRRCPYQQCCVNGQCIDSSMTSTTISKLIDTNNSIDVELRIALGIVASLLGTSVIVLSSALCWLHQRRKRNQKLTEKSLSSLSNSSASSLYVSPNQQPKTFSSSLSTIYHLSYKDENKNKDKFFYRTNSFRQAVLFGYQKHQFIEHVSTKRDSFTNEQDKWSSWTFNSLDFIVPSINNQNQLFNLDQQNNNNNNNNNIYQIIIPSTFTLAHDV